MSFRSYLVFIILLFNLCGCAYAFRSNPVYITQSESYHIVQSGDTLFSISQKYSIPVDQLRLYNNLDSDRIIVGQKIYLTPSVQMKNEYVTVRSIPESGYHVVQRGETVYRISKMYDLEIMDILDYNNLESFDIKVDQKIWLVPGMVERAELPERPEVDSEEQEAVQQEATYHIVQAGENLFRISLRYGMTVDQLKEINNLTSDAISVGQRLVVVPGEPRREPPPPPGIATRRTDLILPVEGRVVSEFGRRGDSDHKGIDITAPIGTPILAVLDGKVGYVGIARGYGNVVIIDHGDNIMTVYAHNERNLVRLGDEVKQGQPIATVGQSGNATGPHLHFEYRVSGKAINPREVLPRL
ncbi:MAG: LysM peptidoglycan-binding domain-containing protein [Candidatus Cloacimonetes bacterium]|nr:LysM peptidoglycan-binding domain-containing protein [Candidatus Cloacimonadota bacterium]